MPTPCHVHTLHSLNPFIFDLTPPYPSQYHHTTTTNPRNYVTQNAYLARYRSRLKGRNILYIGQIQHVLQALSRFLSKHSKQQQKVAASGGATGSGAARAGGADGSATGAAGMEAGGAAGGGDVDGTYRINDLLFKLGIDNLNLFKVRL